MKVPLLILRMRLVLFVLLVTGLVELGSSVWLIGFVKRAEQNDCDDDCRMAIFLLIVMMIVMIISIAVLLLIYIFLMVGAAKREIELCTKLIKQDEATRQAETKSMKKSDAITSASHDVRNALACMTELIKISYDEVSQGSEIKEYLTQLDACVLNSILDKSKIEAGKMVLEDEEFDIFQLVEEVVDFFLPSGLKKGVDVVLDPYDCSLLKFSQVRGDRGRLKQILCNLLGNAVKFTAEGHVTVRAWVQRPSFMNSADSGQNNSYLKYLLCFRNYKDMTEEQSDGIKALNGVQHDPNSLLFFFEVDDTRKGIPKEKQKEFENYVQVKETAHGGGTGLGLGIVQSLVRLMHGEIGIVDKKIGEKGTCFRFNVLLRAINLSEDHNKLQQDLETGGAPSCDDRDQQLGLLANANRMLTINSSPNLTPIGSPRFNVSRSTPSSPKLEESIVVLLIKNEERRRIVYQFMKSSLGIKVSVVEQWEQLAHTLKKIKQMKMKGNHSQNHPSSSSCRSEAILPDCLSKSTSSNSGNRAKEAHPIMSAMDETYNNVCSLFKKTTTNIRGASVFVLLVIDTTAGPYPQLCEIVTEFKRGLQNASCRTVWLDTLQSHDLSVPDPDDVTIKRALHGTRLFNVVRYLPEYGGAVPDRSAEGTFQVGSKVVSRVPSSSRYRSHTDDESDVSSSPIKWHDQSRYIGSTSRNSPVGHDHPLPHRETHEHHNPSTSLSGKRFLLVEDDKLLRYLAIKTLLKEGANVKVCPNGREALDVIHHDLVNKRKHDYDFVLMDCQMPEMDGFEATRQIRKMEKSYHVRIPIIALTAHTPGEETRRMLEAGMDGYLCKPLDKDRLLETMGRLVTK